MLFFLIMNLYVPFGIPFDPKRYYKDGDYAIMLRRPSVSVYEYAVSTLRTECLKFFNLCAALVNFIDMALPPRDQRHQYLRYEGLHYTEADIEDFESRLARIYRREVAQGVSLFTSRAWMRLFDIRGPLVHGLILEFFSTFRFGQAILDLDTPGALQFQLGRARRRMSWRQFILAMGLHTDEEMQTAGFGISSAGDFLGTTPSYTMIWDPILRLFHRLIACSIAGRSQAPEKGLTVIAPELSVIDMAELVRLQICREIDDTWAWVALGPERQHDAAAGAPRVAQDAPVIDEGGQADLAPVQPPPPPAAARTMPQRMAKLEEDMHEIRGALTEQHEVIDAMARNFSRFCTWTTTSLARMMDRAGVTYTSYSQTPREYQRRVRRRTDGASTSAAQQDPQ
ncbi:hypothetical protein Tco_0649197 [Tanacetum coccineum]